MASRWPGFSTKMDYKGGPDPVKMKMVLSHKLNPPQYSKMDFV